MKLIDLTLDTFLGWRCMDKDVRVALRSGDPVVLTISDNGHDAEARYLSFASEQTLIPAQCWYTAETLGTKSTLAFEPDDYLEELAVEDWRPVPRDSVS